MIEFITLTVISPVHTHMFADIHYRHILCVGVAACAPVCSPVGLPSIGCVQTPVLRKNGNHVVMFAY